MFYAFRSLAIRDYRIYVGGHAVSQMGTWMQRLAVIWAVFEITDSGTAVGVASACLFGPALVLSPLGGLMADRYDGRSLLVATKIGLAGTAVLFAFVSFAHPSTPVPYMFVAVLFGVVETFDIPVRMTFVNELVSRDDLPNAIGINTAVMNGSRVVGPTIAGLLISGAGVEWCFAVNIAMAFVVLLSMLAVRPPSRTAPEPPDKDGVLIGFRIAWHNPVLRFALLSFTVMTVFVIVFPVTLPLFAERSLSGGPKAFTLLFSAVGLGSIGGALVVARQSELGPMFIGRTVAWTAVSMAALTIAPNLTVAAFVALAVGFSTMAFMTGAITAVQLNAPPERRGRVLALVSMVGIGSRAVGGLFLGAVSDLFDPRTAVGFGAAVSVLVFVWAFTSSRRAA